MEAVKEIDYTRPDEKSPRGSLANLPWWAIILMAAGLEIITIEGLKGPVADALFKAWEDDDVPQCGYCQPGQVMTAAALLAENPNPSDSDIDRSMDGNLCRCGTYNRIRQAIHLVVQEGV